MVIRPALTARQRPGTAPGRRSADTGRFTRDLANHAGQAKIARTWTPPT